MKTSIETFFHNSNNADGCGTISDDNNQRRKAITR